MYISNSAKQDIEGKKMIEIILGLQSPLDIERENNATTFSKTIGVR